MFRKAKSFDDQIIVVDSGSTDDTMNIANAWGRSIAISLEW
jgi:glycosyltransferase involved in cell wall biosynthesis